jgi:hypothetical protein
MGTTHPGPKANNFNTTQLLNLIDPFIMPIYAAIYKVPGKMPLFLAGWSMLLNLQIAVWQKFL